MSKAKQKGTAFETAVTRYMKSYFPNVERRALQGVNDTGDIAGISIHGKPMVVECKNTKTLNITEHLQELDREQQNAHTKWGVLVQHAPRVGFDNDGNTGKQWAIMPLHTLMELLWKANASDQQTGEDHDRG